MSQRHRAFLFALDHCCHGAWESWGIRLVRNQEIVGSNPTAPTADTLALRF